MHGLHHAAIGLFPDVGSSAWLPHLKHGYGYYIGNLYKILVCSYIILIYVCLHLTSYPNMYLHIM